MRPFGPLPDVFLRELEELENAYLRYADPIEQSGFHGGPERWRTEREPILSVEGRTVACLTRLR